MINNVVLVSDTQQSDSVIQNRVKDFERGKKKILKGLEIFSKPVIRWYANAVTEKLKDVHA